MRFFLVCPRYSWFTQFTWWSIWRRLEFCRPLQASSCISGGPGENSSIYIYTLYTTKFIPSLLPITNWISFVTLLTLIAHLVVGFHYFPSFCEAFFLRGEKWSMFVECFCWKRCVEVPGFFRVPKLMMSPITRLTASNRRWVDGHGIDGIYIYIYIYLSFQKNEQFAPENQCLEDDSCPFSEAWAIFF